jgi:hypothetical protein
MKTDPSSIFFFFLVKKHGFVQALRNHSLVLKAWPSSTTLNLAFDLNLWYEHINAQTS